MLTVRFVLEFCPYFVSVRVSYFVNDAAVMISLLDVQFKVNADSFCGILLPI